jgi:hypothetical protein
MPWIGWLFIRGEWQRVAEGATIGECHRSLLTEAERRGVQRSSYRAMTTGAVPPDPTRKERQ